jgi:excisionase family DNA binding protein
MTEPLIRAREAAGILGMSTAWVLDHWEAGELPGFKLPGGAVRFRASELEDWLTGYRRTVKPLDTPPEIRDTVSGTLTQGS